MEVTIRPKRQITLPKEVCDKLGIGPGDSLELTLKDSVLTARPRKAIALDALQEIRRALRESGVTLRELQAEGRRQRHKLVRERYGSGS